MANEALKSGIPATGVVLAAEGLGKDFPSRRGDPVRALRDFSIEVRRAQITGLVGPDGAGKTTLLRIAAGLLKPTCGSITVLGLDSVRDSLAIQSRVGYMPQKFGLYQDLTVAENMTLYADLQGVPRSEREERFHRLLRMTALEPFARRRAGALSGGMKQKLGLACCLIKFPRLLLLDEPTVGVDPVSRRELWKIVNELVDQAGIGVLLSTAYLDEAERCDCVVVLHQGRKLAEGPPASFREKVAGRVYLVTPPAGTKPRRIQTHLAGRPHIVDATIRSGRVRVVADEAGAPAVASALPAEWRPGIHEAAPVFEDAFITLIPAGENPFRPGGQDGDLDVRSTAKSTMERAKDEEPVVSTKDLRKLFGGFEAVKRLTFEVMRGEIFGLLGPNGAGKSTTFRMLCGLLKASAGEIRVAGRDLRSSGGQARARLGYMAQQFSLYTQLTVEENLRFFGRAYGLDPRRLGRRMEWAFSEFGLGPWRDHAAGGLPGGYKQRLAMAAALLHEPEILFLDEPTSGVDPFARREFWLRINGFAEQDVTVVVTTHFMEESEYCDRILIMSQGETLAMGAPAEIRGLVRSDENPDPTIEDAFIALAEGTGGRGKGESP